MTTIFALFDSYADAASAVRALKAHDIDDDDISLVANRSDPPADAEKPAAEGAELGSDLGGIAGGAAGLLAGLGVIAIPGLGPVVGAGWLVTTAVGLVTGSAVGMATGGLIGALVHEGAPHEDAHTYNEGVRGGGTLVTVRLEPYSVAAARHLLAGAARLDVRGPQPGVNAAE